MFKFDMVSNKYSLYDILNEFQEGGHMAAVIEVKNKNHLPTDIGDLKSVGKNPNKFSQLTKPLFPKLEQESDFVVIINKPSKSSTCLTTKGLTHFTNGMGDGEVIRIITLEDVFEELLQNSGGGCCCRRLICGSSSFSDKASCSKIHVKIAIPSCSCFIMHKSSSEEAVQLRTYLYLKRVLPLDHLVC